MAPIVRSKERAPTRRTVDEYRSILHLNELDAMIAAHMRRLTFATFLGLWCGAPASAQEGTTPRGRVAVRVIVPQHTRAGQDVLVTRRADDGGYVIVLPSDAATPANLFVGALAVTGLMETDGDDHRDQIVRRIPRSTSAPRREVALGTEVLARLQ
ncbi:MAG TPA: hypothetical protein VF625_06625, partial [Longimicrobium sp.]